VYQFLESLFFNENYEYILGSWILCVGIGFFWIEKSIKRKQQMSEGRKVERLEFWKRFCFGSAVIWILLFGVAMPVDLYFPGPWRIYTPTDPGNMKDYLNSAYITRQDSHFYKLSVFTITQKRSDLGKVLAKINDGASEEEKALIRRYGYMYLEQKEADEDREQGKKDKTKSMTNALLAAEKYLGKAIQLENIEPFSTNGKEFGPSAGLIYALELVHQQGDIDLIRGRKIAGTGEIKPDGTVLPIGGEDIKIYNAAKRGGMDICLLPIENYERLQRERPGYIESMKPMKVLKVASLQDAIEQLSR